MSDIGLKGVAGLIVIGATAGLAVLAVLVASIAAAVISSRRAIPFGPTFGRLAAGPLAAVAVAVAGVIWAWDGPGDAVDKLAPVIGLGSLVAGVVVGFLVHRSARAGAPPRR